MNNKHLARKKILFIWIVIAFSASLGMCFLGSIVDIASDFGVSLSVAGQVVSIYSLSFALLGPVLVKKFGRYDYYRTIMYSLLLLLAINLVTRYATTIGVLFGIRIISAAIVSFIITKCFGYVTEHATKETLSKYLGILYTSFAAANTFLIPLYSYLSTRYGWLSIPTILLISFALLAATLHFFIKLESKNKTASSISDTPHDKTDNSSKLSKKQDNAPRPWYTDSYNIKLLATTFLVLGSNMILMGYITPYFLRLGASENMISLVLFLFGLGGIIGSYTSSKISNLFSEQKSLQIILLVYSCFFLLIYFIENIYVLAAMIFIWSASQWSSGPLIQKMLVQNANNHREGEILLNINMSFINFGISFGVMVGGMVINYNLDIIPLVSMLVASIAFFIQSFIAERRS